MANEPRENAKIAVIGDRDSVLAFKAVGAEVFAVTNPFAVRETVKKLAREGYAVILITERVAENVQEIIKRYKSVPYPVIIPIPDSAGSTGLGMSGITEDVEKAIGTDILSNT